MRDYIITISGVFFVCHNQCKTFKESCNKKGYKKFDVTIDITLNRCYSTTIRCNKQGYNKFKEVI